MTVATHAARSFDHRRFLSPCTQHEITIHVVLDTVTVMSPRARVSHITYQYSGGHGRPLLKRSVYVVPLKAQVPRPHGVHETFIPRKPPLPVLRGHVWHKPNPHLEHLHQALGGGMQAPLLQATGQQHVHPRDEGVALHVQHIGGTSHKVRAPPRKVAPPHLRLVHNLRKHLIAGRVIMAEKAVNPTCNDDGL